MQRRNLPLPTRSDTEDNLDDLMVCCLQMNHFGERIRCNNEDGNKDEDADKDDVVEAVVAVVVVVFGLIAVVVLSPCCSYT